MGLSSRVGGNFKTKEEVINFFVTSIEKWRENLGIEQMFIVGHSFGGMISFYYTLLYSKRVKHLMLISPAGISHNYYDIFSRKN